MITLLYGPDGENVNNFNHEEWLESVIARADEDVTICVSTSLPILAVQVAILEKRLDYRKVQFVTQSELDAFYRPSPFTGYGRVERGIFLGNDRTQHKLALRFQQLEAEKRYKEDQKLREDVYAF